LQGHQEEDGGNPGGADEFCGDVYDGFDDLVGEAREQEQGQHQRHIVGIEPGRGKLGRLSMRRLNHPVYRNRVLQVCADGALVALAFYLAFRLRFLDQNDLPHRYWVLFAQSLGFVIAIKLIVFAAFGMYQKWWRYVSGRDFLQIVRAATVSSAI